MSAPSLKQRLAAWAAQALRPRMVYGQRDGAARRPHSRVSTHSVIEAPALLRLGDHVFIGHFNFIDASGGLSLGDGVQITNHCSVLTHSTHRAVRLEREAFYGHPSPAGAERLPTAIGAWTFIGPHSVIAPGSRLGVGVLVKAYSYVRGEVPDFAVLEGQPGQPARVVGDTRELDRAWMERQPEGRFDDGRRAAYDAWVASIGGAV